MTKREQTLQFAAVMGVLASEAHLIHRSVRDVLPVHWSPYPQVRVHPVQKEACYPAVPAQSMREVRESRSRRHFLIRVSALPPE